MPDALCCSMRILSVRAFASLVAALRTDSAGVAMTGVGSACSMVVSRPVSIEPMLVRCGDGYLADDPRGRRARTRTVGSSGDRRHPAKPRRASD
ncbi:MAG TPA: hypothetical protein VFZ11_14650, partial [Gemmatimonadaceae bacterium]